MYFIYEHSMKQGKFNSSIFYEGSPNIFWPCVQFIKYSIIDRKNSQNTIFLYEIFFLIIKIIMLYIIFDLIACLNISYSPCFSYTYQNIWSNKIVFGHGNMYVHNRFRWRTSNSLVIKCQKSGYCFDRF